MKISGSSCGSRISQTGATNSRGGGWQPAILVNIPKTARNKKMDRLKVWLALLLDRSMAANPIK